MAKSWILQEQLQKNSKQIKPEYIGIKNKYTLVTIRELYILYGENSLEESNEKIKKQSYSYEYLQPIFIDI